MASRKRSDTSPPSSDDETKKEIVKWSLSNWMTFLMERAPPVVFLLLAAGPCLSGLQTSEGHVDLSKFLWSVIGELVLLLIVRVMDDVKDFEKDKIVHPERPLPRGLIRYDEVVTVIHMTLVAMFTYALLLGLQFNWSVGGLYGLQVVYVVLMYIEFGIGEWLEERPLLYGVSHQLSIYFGAMFICVLGGAKWNSLVGFLMGSVAFSGFFTYEVCRKLDPTLPKIKGTYLVIYGKWLTFLFTVVTVAIGAASSYAVGLHWLLWPLEALMITSLFVLFLLPVKGPKPKSHKPVEALSIIYLLVHMWAGYIARFF